MRLTYMVWMTKRCYIETVMKCSQSCSVRKEPAFSLQNTEKLDKYGEEAVRVSQQTRRVGMKAIYKGAATTNMSQNIFSLSRGMCRFTFITGNACVSLDTVTLAMVSLHTAEG